MAKRSVLGLFKDPDSAAEGVENLRRAGLAENEYEVLTGTPYPEGTFGEKPVKHHLYVFPFIGALSGLSVAILLTIGTQASTPLVTGGKPILSIPPMVIIAFEGTMLGAILFTVLGILFELRLPRAGLGLYDRRITEGLIGVLATCEEAKLGVAEQALQQAGPVEVKRESLEGGQR